MLDELQRRRERLLLGDVARRGEGAAADRPRREALESAMESDILGREMASAGARAVY